MSTAVKMHNVPKAVSALLNPLTLRHRDVLYKRFGLKDGKPHTLEEIGKEYGITRERVRQIENDAKAAVRQSDAVRELAPIFAQLSSHFERHGGMRAEPVLFENDVRELFHTALDMEIARAYLSFLLSLHDLFVKHKETDSFHAVWGLSHIDPAPAKKALEDLVEKLNTHRQPVPKEELLGWLRELCGESQRDVLESHLTLSKQIGANVFGEYGLSHWPEITARGVRDKAYVVLKKHRQPMHFRGIVDRINDAFKSGRRAHPQTVHNELIKNDRFVLVGRGTYALAEWGYRPGKVADVLVRILQDAPTPLTKEEIVEAVLKERNVKLNTILLNLQNRAYFERMGDGRFALKKPR